MILLGDRPDKQTFAIGRELENAVCEVADHWRVHRMVRRLWQCDQSVWTAGDEDRWLGWLGSVQEARNRIDGYRDFADSVKRDGFTDALVLGMGGSSLGPEVLSGTFERKTGWPALRILDSTDPAEITEVEAARHCAHAVHRLQQIRKHDRAEHAFDVLAQRGRRALRVHLKGDRETSLGALCAAVERALA